MTTDRKLEEIVSNLDDMSMTIEEIKDQECTTETTDKLDSLQLEMTRATDLIEEALESKSTDRAE